jgi:hypothetical protein
MKVLFCDNEFGDWEEAREIPDQYAGRPLDGLVKYKADFLGLKSWLGMYEKIDFSSYDLIWIYLGHRKMIPSWYVFPRLVRQKAPDAKIVFTTDYEGLWFDREFDLRMRYAWEHADVMHTITKQGFDFFSKNLSIPVVYGHFGCPHAGGLKYIPPPVPKYKKKGIVFIRHTNMPSIIPQLEIIKRMRMKAIALDSVPPPFSHGEHIKLMAESLAIKNITVYPRLDFVSYLQVLSGTYVGIDNHVGPSRFSYEMAQLQIPVVHTCYSEYGNVLFPFLTCPHGDISAFVEQIRKLRKSPEKYRKIAEFGHSNSQKYFGLKACKRRLSKFVKKLMGGEVNEHTVAR